MRKAAFLATCLLIFFSVNLAFAGKPPQWLIKLAEKGDAQAQFLLGNMYYSGQLTTQNYSEALKWLLKAAKQGDTRAQYDLGIMYDYGQSTPRNYHKALN